MLHITPPHPKKWLKILFLLTITIILCAIIGTILLWCVYHISYWDVATNIYESADILQREGFSPSPLPWCTSQLDTWTDSLMLIIAGTRTSQRTIVQAMSIPVPSVDGESFPYETLLAHYLNGAPYSDRWEYSRYWHGYLVFLKPLLMITDYNGIRFLNATMQSLFLLILCYLMKKRCLNNYIPAFLLSLSFLAPTILMNSMQYSSCYYIMILGSIGLLALKDDHYVTYAPYVFLFIGIWLAYFDFLTYPTITFGIPAVLYCCRRSKMDFKDIVKEGFRLCFCWSFGYIGMWSSKWILGSLILQENVLQDALQNIAFRTSTDNTQASQLLQNIPLSIQENLKNFFYTPSSIYATVLVLVIIVQICRNCKRSNYKVAVDDYLPFVILAFIPFIWYSIASNHSIIHSFFTNKALMVTVFSILCCLTRIHSNIRKQFVET